MFAIRREQGRLAEVAPVLRLLAAGRRPAAIWRPGLAALFAEPGMLDEARRDVRALAPDGFAAVARDSMWPAASPSWPRCAWPSATVDRAEVLYEELAAFRGRNLMVGFTICLGPADRLIGGLAALLGRAERRRPLRRRPGAGRAQPVAGVEGRGAARLGDAARPGDEAARRCCAARGPDDRAPHRHGPPGRAAAEPAAGPRRSPSGRPDGLSAREVEVLRLVAAGLSNREIGERLFISQNTAANHVRAILQKTGCANRTEAAAYAVRSGLAGQSSSSYIGNCWTLTTSCRSLPSTFTPPARSSPRDGCAATWRTAGSSSLELVPADELAIPRRGPGGAG